MLNKVSLYEIDGIPVSDILDRQHAAINRTQQKLRSSIIEGTGLGLIIGCAKELIATTLEHFASEESALDASALQSFESHRRLHIEMIESLKEISGDLEHRRIRGALELMKFFDARLTYHLDVEDAIWERQLRNMNSGQPIRA